MEEQGNFMLNLSVLFRNTQKFYDRMLAKFEIGSGQLIFLTLINENEGMTMMEVTKISEVDKGTTTKSVNRLIEQGYVETKVDENDHRIKRLYTTLKATKIMNDVYEYRNACRNSLALGVDFDTFEKNLGIVTQNSRLYLNESQSFDEIRIGSFTKTCFGDVSGKVTSRIAMTGCQFKCPYCNQKNLVYVPENNAFVKPDGVLEYLKKRVGFIDTVEITGGEPLLQVELKPFIETIRNMGYQIRLYTNGSDFESLKNLIDEKVVDEVVMDVKNRVEKYAKTVGLPSDHFDVSEIEQSISFLKESDIPHLFRTTLIKEFHTVEDCLEIAGWIGKESHYLLQQYKEQDDQYHAYTEEEMMEICQKVRLICPQTEIRSSK